jgi:hypothetical protein
MSPKAHIEAIARPNPAAWKLLARCNSVVVEPGKPIPELIIDMSLPVMWQNSEGINAPSEMRDVIKVFISTQQASFAHHQLPDLGDSSPENKKLGTFRNARRT